jgi:hypothetical protein
VAAGDLAPRLVEAARVELLAEAAEDLLDVGAGARIGEVVIKHPLLDGGEGKRRLELGRVHGEGLWCVWRRGWVRAQTDLS